MKESYRLDELARAWQKSYWTLLRMIKDGRLTAFKVGSTWRVTARERERIEKKGINPLTSGASSEAPGSRD